jgi:hypothetical protein
MLKWRRQRPFALGIGRERNGKVVVDLRCARSAGRSGLIDTDLKQESCKHTGCCYMRSTAPPPPAPVAHEVFDFLSHCRMSEIGPSPTHCDVRDLVAIRWKADVTRTLDFGRDRPNSEIDHLDFAVLHKMGSRSLMC